MTDELIKKLQTMMDNKRLEHSIGVSLTAGKLAEYYHQDVEKAKLAGLVHDCAKCLTLDEMQKLLVEYGLSVDKSLTVSRALLHGPLGARIAEKELNIDDPIILNAIAVHTTGRKGMTIFEKIVCLADFIEPGRKFSNVERIRELAYTDLDLALLKAFDLSIKSIIRKGKLLHPQTVEARDDLVLALQKKKNPLME